MSRLRRYAADRALQLLLASDDENSASETDDIIDNTIQRMEEQVEDESYSSSESEEESEVISQGAMINGNYKSRDGSEWLATTTSDRPIRPTVASNIVRTTPGPTTFAKRTVRDCVSAFLRIFDESCMRKVYQYTLSHIQTTNDSEFSIDLADIYSFVGLLFARGVFLAKNEPLFSLWSNEFGRKLFTDTMSRNKFKFIMKHIRFDEQSTRSQRRLYDRFCAIRELWTRFVENSQASYQPSFHMTVDEQLFPMKTRCPFLQFMPNKPDKFGAKFWILADAESRYIYNAFPYLGRELTQNRGGMQLGEFVTLKLLEPYFGGGYNVTVDSFFTSLSLSEKLFRESITLVGTMKKSRREIPNELQHDKKRQVNSVVGARHASSNAIIISYKVKSNKSVIMLSTMHTDTSMDGNKPEIVKFYNRTKAGVDSVDQMARMYSTKSASRRWPLQIFFNLLDLAAINAYTLHREITGSTTSRRDFILELTKGLIDMSRPPPLPRSEPSPAPKKERPNKRKKCRLCNKNCTSNRCTKCDRYVCGPCTITTCKDCFE